MSTIMSTEYKKEQIQEFRLAVNSELRFEVESKNEKVFLTLKTGSAEIFGTELVQNKVYEFTAGAKIGVFSWHGCTIELKGKTDVSYIARETPMVIYSNCHAGLEDMRSAAEKANKGGPVAMVVGPGDVGKSTVCKILLNYAARMGRRPLFVDLDVEQGQISVPGTIGALLIERPATLEKGFSKEAPLVYNFGHETPQANCTLFNMLCMELAKLVQRKAEKDKKIKSSGVIINTCSWVKGEGYKQLMQTIKVFEVDIIFVLDQERLYNELVRDMLPYRKVVLLPKSRGVVEKSQSARAESRDQRIREYFYGTPKDSMHPNSFDIKWSEIKIFKIGGPSLPDSCLPFGMKPENHLKKVVPLTPNFGMIHHLLAVSFATKEDEQLILSHVLGFVCVTNIDMKRQTFTLLSPQPGPLPNNLLLFSEFQFAESY